jgi:hypothetical protein
MKRSKRLSVIVKITFVTILLTGCEKIAEFLPKHGDADIKFCNIAKIYASRALSNDVNATISYNALGNPTSIIFSRPTTGMPNRIFKYDAHHRLTDDIGDYTNGSFELWRKFYYDRGGHIIRDTTYHFGTLGPQPTGEFWRSVSHYEYDSYNRISKIMLEPNIAFPIVTEQTYSYDENGNLVKPDVVNDNKLNIHRTNKIWMFLDRDYSVNNPFSANSYNNNRLPTSINTGDATHHFLDLYFQKATIQYLCR